MSGKDETDLVRNKEITTTTTTTTEHSTEPSKLNSDQIHDHTNGDSVAATNGDSSIESKEKSKQTIAESTPKPSTPSNWVKFESEDASDTVLIYTRLISHYLHLFHGMNKTIISTLIAAYLFP